MAQIFSRRASTSFRVFLVLVPMGLALSGGLAFVWARSDAFWSVGEPEPQPIPFRHSLHSGDLKIDCRYCHTSVERAAHAGMPSAQTCMSCHGQLLAGESALEPIRSSLALGEPIRWTSVSRLPDHVVFHHAAHVTKGVACETCHGRVDQMPRTVKAQTLSMGWCLDCHRDPAPRLRPRDAVLAFGWVGTAPSMSEDVRRAHAAAAPRLTSCNTCHR